MREGDLKAQTSREFIGRQRRLPVSFPGIESGLRAKIIGKPPIIDNLDRTRSKYFEFWLKLAGESFVSSTESDSGHLTKIC